MRELPTVGPSVFPGPLGLFWIFAVPARGPLAFQIAARPVARWHWPCVTNHEYFLPRFSALIAASCEAQRVCSGLGVIFCPCILIRLPIQKSTLTGLRCPDICASGRQMIRIARATSIILVLANTNDAQAASKLLSSDHWLLGEFTQNAPCRGVTVAIQQS